MKHIHNLDKKNREIQITEIKELNKWRDSPFPWIGKLIIVKISGLPNLISKVNAIPFKIPAGYFVNINKLIPKCACRIGNTI